MDTNNLNPLNTDSFNNDIIDDSQELRNDISNLHIDNNFRNKNLLKLNREAQQNSNNAKSKIKLDAIDSENYNNDELWNDAKSLNRIIPSLKRYREENSIKSDENFMLDTKMLKENNVQIDYWDDFNDVNSKEQFDKVLENLNTEIKTKERMKLVGSGKEFGVNLLAGITDPVQIAIGAATGGIFTIAKGGSIASKLGIAVVEGMAEGAITGAIFNKTQHTYNTTDLLSDVIAGGLLSGTFSGIGQGIKKGIDYKNSKFNETFSEELKINEAAEIAKSNKYNENIKNGDDLEVDSNIDISKDVVNYVEAHEAYNYRRTLEENYFKTPERIEIIENWKGQNLKTISEIEKSNNKLQQYFDAFDEAVDTNDYGSIKPLQNNISKQQKSINDLSVKLENQEAELNKFNDLQPIEQMQFISDKTDEIFKDLNLDDPNLKAKLDMDYTIKMFKDDEVKALNDIKKDVEILKTTKNVDENLDELDFLSLKLEEQQRKVDLFDLENKQINEKGINNEENNIFGEKSASAAEVKNPEKYVDTDSFSQKYEGFGFDKTENKRINSIVREQDDNVHSEINQLSGPLKKLQTISAQLNHMGGKAALFGDLIFGRIGSKQNTVALQKKHYRTMFEHSDLKEQRKQYINEMSKVSGWDLSKPRTNKEMNIAINALGKDLNEVKNGDFTAEQLQLANKFNKATKQSYKVFNASRKLPVEIRKNLIQKHFSERFQSILEKPIDGNISLERAYKNEKGKAASRNKGFSEARNEMNEMLGVYGLDKEQFNIRYPNISNELKNALNRSQIALEKIYRDLAIELEKSGADTSGVLKNLIEANKVYQGPTVWKAEVLDAFDNEFGNDSIVNLFQKAIESKDPNTKYSKSVKKKVESGKLDETTAKTTNKPLSKIYAEAIVNNNIRRFRNKNVSGRDLEDGFALALNDIEKYVRENEESLKDILDSDDFIALKNDINIKKEAAADKTGIDKYSNKKIEIDYFFKSEMLGSNGVSKTVSISDFLQLNKEKTMQTYLNTSSSHISFAKNGIRSVEDLDKLLQDMVVENNRKKDLGKKSDATPEEIKESKNVLTDKDLQFYNDVAKAMWNGQSMIDYSTPVNKFLQYLSNYNFMRQMGKMSIAQLSEWSEIAHQAGFMNMLSSIPSLKKLRKDLYNAKGEQITEIGEAIEAAGLLPDTFDSQFFNDLGVDDAITTSNFGNIGNSKVKNTANDVFFKASRFAGALSSKMDKATRKVATTASLSELDKIARFFEKDGSVDWLKHQKEVLTKKGINEDTLTDYGISMQDLPSIKKAFDDYAVFKTGFTGNRIITGMNFEKLKIENRDLYETFETFIVNAQNEVVAPATIGSSYKPLVNNIIAKIMFQFQNYGLQSLNHKVRNKFKPNNNIPMFLMLGGLTGFTAYSLNILANAPKYKNSDEYLNDKFSMSKVLAGSYSRSVYAWYMPAIMGSVESFISDDSHIFDESTRTSGLSQGIMSNPTTDLLDNTFNLAKNSLRYATTLDDEYLSKAMNNSVNLLPWASAPILGPGLQTMAKSGKRYKKK